jgi:hypothetical protein
MAFDLGLLIITIVSFVSLLLGNAFFLAHYAHHADSFFTESILAKLVLMIGYLLAESQILGMALDVQNMRETASIKMDLFWYVSMMIQTLFIIFVLPLGLFYSESQQKFCPALLKAGVVGGICSGLLVTGWLMFAYSEIPVSASTCMDTDFVLGSATVTPSPCKRLDPVYLNVALTFPIYVTACMTFIGWFMLLFFLPTGMWSWFFESLATYFTRPE